MINKTMYTKAGTSVARPLLLAALSVALGACSGNNSGSTSGGTLAASTFTAPSATQGSAAIIALDPVNQAIWVPSYTLDANGNLQYELIGTAAAVAGGTAAVSKKVSMMGCDTPVGIAFAASGVTSGSLLVECGNSSTQALSLSAVDASSLAVTPVATPGLTWNGNGGGIIVDPQHNQAFVAGSQNVGLLLLPAGGAPGFEANSVTTLPADLLTGVIDNAVSMAMDFTTQQVVIANPSTLLPYLVDASTVNTAAPALNITQLPPVADSRGNFLPFQGAAFDSATGLLALSSDSATETNQDLVGVLNMTTFSAANFTVDSVAVNGFLDYYVGPYPNIYNSKSSTGGLAALNPTTHRVLAGDAWGPNLLLIQLPTAPVPASTPTSPTDSDPVGGLNNNGQPSIYGIPATTPPDPKSAYAIAQTLVSVQTTGTPAQLNALGAPPALVIDSVNNIAYVLADNSAAPHGWTANTGVTLTLVSLDLSAPVPNACPSPTNLCASTWNPRTAQVVVP